MTGDGCLTSARADVSEKVTSELEAESQEGTGHGWTWEGQGRRWGSPGAGTRLGLVKHGKEASMVGNMVS